LDGLYALRAAGVPFRVTIGITPILAEQLSDPLIVQNFVSYAAERAAWAATDVARFEQSGETALRDVARFYHHWYARVLTSFQDRYGRNILGRLQDAPGGGADRDRDQRGDPRLPAARLPRLDDPRAASGGPGDVRAPLR
jgi:predicted glycosyl hydrolase (DUF1957 family)